MATSEAFKIIIQARDEARETLERLRKELANLDKQSKKSSKSMDVLSGYI